MRAQSQGNSGMIDHVVAKGDARSMAAASVAALFSLLQLLIAVLGQS